MVFSLLLYIRDTSPQINEWMNEIQNVIDQNEIESIKNDEKVFCFAFMGYIVLHFVLFG